jgi:glycosyltransferase involved in cell wall biosynthesis
MIKILLVADLKGWIFERHCNEIKKRLSHKYQLDIVYSRPHGRKLAKLAKPYDIVYILDPMPLSYPPKEKVILGCRAERLHGPGNEKSFYEDGLNGVYPVPKDRCSVFHVVNDRQYNMFKDIVTDRPFFLTQHGVNIDIFNSLVYTRENKTSNFVVGTTGRVGSPNKKGFSIVQKACKDLGIEFLTATYEGKKRTLEEMPDFYNKIDVYVCMSHTEGLCNPIMEAGAMGIPVISTRSGAAEEMVFDGVNGFLVDRNVDALKEALVKFNDYELRRKLGVEMSLEICQNFSWDVKIKEFEEMFDRMIELNNLGGQ